MILIVPVCIALLFGVIAFKLFSTYHDVMFGICFTVSLLSTMVVIIMAVEAVKVQIPYFRKTELFKYEHQYNSIMYAFDANPNNMIILADDVADYNSEVLKGRLLQDSVWLGILNYDFYYDLPIIELDTK